MLKKKIFIGNLTRRSFLTWVGALAGSSLIPLTFKNIWAKGFMLNESFADYAEISSPTVEAFIDPLPFPPPPVESPFDDPDPLACPDPEDRANARFFQVCEEEVFVKIHSTLPPARVWRYRDVTVDKNDKRLDFGYLGPTFQVFTGKRRQTVIVRYINKLPVDPAGFGLPCSTVHYHGGHVEARSDGFPENQFDGPHPFTAPVVFCPPNFPGFEEPDNGPTLQGDLIPPPHGSRASDENKPTQYDYCFAMRDPGFSGKGGSKADPTERPATQWYHDHLFDFTGPNVVRGLAGFFLSFDELDTGNEEEGLQLPSGPKKPDGQPNHTYDIPLVFQDRLLEVVGNGDGTVTTEFIYPPGVHDGYLGDTFLVNGVIQPFLEVERRKYRFRLLNGSNARFYKLFLVDEASKACSWDRIANGGGLFARPIRDEDTGILLTMAGRADIVIDFSTFEQGNKLYLENRAIQDDGRGPEGDFLDPELLDVGKRLLEFRVGGAPDKPDNSQVPDVLRPFHAITQEEIDDVPEERKQTLVFDRRHGAWTINNETAELDFEHSVVQPEVNKPVIWKLVNKSGGWWHPVHIHLELMRVLTRNGKTPPLDERDGFSKTDTVILGPNDEVEVYLNFRDFPGPWVLHCHNIEHEDMRMMARFDVVDGGVVP